MAITVTNRALRLVGNIYGRPAEVHHYPIDTTGIEDGAAVAAGIGNGSLVVRLADGRVAAPVATALVNGDTNDMLFFEDHAGRTDGTEFQLGTLPAEEQILGIALKRSLGMAQDDLMPVALLMHGSILEGNLMDGIVGTGTAEVLAAVHLGQRVGIIRQGTQALNDVVPGFWGFTIATGAVADLVGTIYKSPLGLADSDALGGGIGDTNAVVQVVWSPQAQLTMF